MPRAIAPPRVPLAKPVEAVPAGTLRQLRLRAADCRACPLWRDATQTVFGAGPARAAVMLIGEQPGDQEDRQGEPFVGPAGQLLRQLLAECGLAADEVYLTNTVKHFKFRQRGKRRLHQRANAAEQAACRPWLAAELSRLRPRWVVALGAMAAQTLFGNAFRLTRERGRWRALDERTDAIASWHPSAILRMQGEPREQALRDLRGDLRKVAARVAGDVPPTASGDAP
ncbi:UdgX family uracil-DNA binding protein [Pseudoxanthomonas sp.]|jgi:DNA polymerase|uniref:UdgX family uracil-DNA binding protein n=1 Tax=Pseudoxanthomonas sp. TaxID=1871049 RepID=UPI003F7E7D92